MFPFAGFGTRMAAKWHCAATTLSASASTKPVTYLLKGESKSRAALAAAVIRKPGMPCHATTVVRPPPRSCFVADRLMEQDDEEAVLGRATTQ